MKATDLTSGEQGELFVTYVTDSDNSGADTDGEGSSNDTSSESKAFH